MTEFDFDELDRAVNNLMSDVDTSKRAEGLDDPEEKTVELADTNAQPAPVSTPATVTQPLATKRRGQFMDFVHPASDMTSSAPAKRQEVVIQPAAPAPSNDQSAAPSTETSASVEEPAKDETSVSNDTGEPLNLNALQTPATEAIPDHIDQTNSSDNVSPPMESPFLADAKVEKRPLGTPSDANESADSSYAPAPNESQPEPSQPAEQAIPEITPKELTPEIMNIESNPVTQSTPEQSSSVPQSPENPVTAENSTPTDIVPQYSESVSHDNEPSGAIYDTAAYHQPLEHPAKKHSGWGIIIWILLLLIIGAVAGAAYFYFTTQY